MPAAHWPILARLSSEVNRLLGELQMVGCEWWNSQAFSTRSGLAIVLEMSSPSIDTSDCGIVAVRGMWPEETGRSDQTN